LETATGQTVLAQIPRAPVTKRHRLVRYLATKPASAMAESVRNLRTSVMLSNVDNPPQIIMITSSLPGEGKTTQSLALAHSFASMGRRVLLIEGDIRRRTFREYFRIRSQTGLIRAVMEDLPFDEVVFCSKDLGIDVLVGEKSRINAADFFSSARIQVFLDRARAEYDIVIIDTPPVLVVPDARVIGQLADAVLYAVRWNSTTRAQLEEGLNALATVDVKVSGLVLSQVDVRKAAQYGGRYRDVYAAHGSRYYRN
jgi:capsular exopolysaccharide synthesis family protein